MSKQRLYLLIQPAFLFSIALLLFNDLSFKYEFHNWVTGKLSDFAGLFALAIFLIAFFPSKRKQVLITVAIFFAWWKSPLASSFIWFCQNKFELPINRVVDYTDLIALIVLPFAYRSSDREERISIYPKPVLIAVMSFVALFAFCFTSMPRNAMYYQEKEGYVSYYKYFKTIKSQEQVLQALTQKGIFYTLDSITYRRTNADFVWRAGDSNTVKWNAIPNAGDSLIYIRRAETPFYTISSYTINGKLVKDIRFSFYKGKKKNDISVLSFISEEYLRSNDAKMRREFKKALRDLFE